jgi:hypothetical protein
VRPAFAIRLRRARRLAAATVMALGVGLLAFAAGCDEKLSDIAGPTPGLAPTFSSIQANIFESTDPSGRAACIQCHTRQGGRIPPLGLSLDHDAAYLNLVGVASAGKAGAVRVVPGDAENSYLVHKLDGRSEIVGQRMPRTSGPFLTEGQISIIRRWIDQGAQNN